MLTFPARVQIWSLDAIVSQSMAKKCIKMKNSRARRAEMIHFDNCICIILTFSFPSPPSRVERSLFEKKVKFCGYTKEVRSQQQSFDVILSSHFAVRSFFLPVTLMRIFQVQGRRNNHGMDRMISPRNNS